MFGSCLQPIKANEIILCELEILNIQSEQQQQRDEDLRSPLVSAVHVNCLWTVILLFVEVTHLGHQNQKKLMHQMDYQHPPNPH